MNVKELKQNEQTEQAAAPKEKYITGIVLVIIGIIALLGQFLAQFNLSHLILPGLGLGFLAWGILAPGWLPHPWGYLERHWPGHHHDPDRDRGRAGQRAERRPLSAQLCRWLGVNYPTLGHFHRRDPVVAADSWRYHGRYRQRPAHWRSGADGFGIHRPYLAGSPDYYWRLSHLAAARSLA